MPTTMTAQHFEFIAEVFASQKPPADDWDIDFYDQFGKMVRAFADALADTNPLFDRDRFLKAAGL